MTKTNVTKTNVTKTNVTKINVTKTNATKTEDNMTTKPEQGHAVGFEASNAQRLREDAALRWAFLAERLRIEVAVRLNQFREAIGISQEEMARRSGTTQPMLSRFFRGDDERSPNIETIVKLADSVGRKVEIRFVEQEIHQFEWSSHDQPIESSARWAGAVVRHDVDPAASAARATRAFRIAGAAEAVAEA